MKITIKLNQQKINDIKKTIRQSAVETMEVVHSKINDTVPLDQGGLMNSIFVSDESDENKVCVKLDHSVIYARYLYYGLKMVDSETGKGPSLIYDKTGAEIGYRFRKGAKLRVKYPEESLNFRNGRTDHWLEPFINGKEKDFIKVNFADIMKRRLK